MKVVLKNMGCKGVLNLIERSESPHRKTQELNRDWVVVAISRLYLPPNEEEKLKLIGNIY